MKICFLTHSLNPRIGIGVFSKNFVETLARERPDWTVHTVVEHGTGHHIEKGIFSMGLSNFPRALFRVRRMSASYDVIHALDGFPYGVLAILATIGLRRRVFITAVGSGAVVMLSKRATRPVVSWCYRRADAFFAISNYTAKKVRHYIPDLVITPVPLGVSRDEFAPSSVSRPVLKDIASKKPYLLVVGTFKYRKGLFEIARGYAEAVKKVPNLRCIFEGDYRNEYGSAIRRFLEERGLIDRVFFLGKVQKDVLRTLYHNAHLFAMLPKEVPGNHDIEGFGLVFLEAAAAGIPIIGSTEGPTRDAVAEGKNAILVNPNDIAAISDAIVSVATDDALRTRMSKASREFARLMSWERTVGAYLSFYEDRFSATICDVERRNTKP